MASNSDDSSKPFTKIHFFIGEPNKQLNCKIPEVMWNALNTLAERTMIRGNNQDITIQTLEILLCENARRGVISWPEGDPGE
jgi:hypothetical protein